MIRHMFVFGVVIPTVITITVFIGFLICWFKLNLGQRFFKKKKLVTKAVSEDGVVKVSTLQGPDKYHPDASGGTPHCSHEDEGGGGGEGSGGAMPIRTGVTNILGGDGDPDNCGCSDAEMSHMALCIADNQHNDRLHGLCNPNLCASPTEAPPSNPAGCPHPSNPPSGECLVQHTFHFPACDGAPVNCIPGDPEECGSDDGNYGHFVPLEHAMKDPKMKQYFQQLSKPGSKHTDRICPECLCTDGDAPNTQLIPHHTTLTIDPV